MTGILNFLKPPGMTSFDAVAWARRVYGVKKAGHCGTLDPDAAGVLPICIGAATGAAGYLTDSKKTYRVEAIAGLLTDTLDISGNVLDRSSCDLPGRSRFDDVLASFAGESMQVPPMYSAVKVGGQKLYKLARKGVETDRPPRAITIYSLDTVFYGDGRVILDATCSKGTYVRSLCGDIGEALGIHLCVSFLIRTASAGFHIKDSLTPAEVLQRIECGSAESTLTPVGAVFSHYPAAHLSGEQYVRFKNGATVIIDDAYPICNGDNGGSGGDSDGIGCDCGGSDSGGGCDCGGNNYRDDDGVKCKNNCVDGGSGEAKVRVYHEGEFLGLGLVAPGYTDAQCSLRVLKFMCEQKG